MSLASRQILIRADASRTIGTGHIMRCLTLATALRNQGHEVSFASVPAPGDCIASVEAAGFPVLRLQQTDETIPTTGGRFDWLVVDHYGLEARWEQAMRAVTRNIMVIDDLADRPHDADLLVDQNRDHTEADYRPLISENCRLLIGPQYALLREEFRIARNPVKPAGNGIRQLLISFGGSDPTGETAKTLTALAGMPPAQRPENIVVVVGGSFEGLAALQQQFHWPGLSFRQNIADMAQVLSQSDLVIGGGGTTSWERCCLGAPSVIIAVADNQRGISRSLAEYGAAQFLGMHATVTAADIQAALIALQSDPGALNAMRQQAAALVDGLGVDRVTAAMTTVALAGHAAPPR
ncbi:MAG: UDP-2,4-diacetamido-2,4,6-trideoxy-beta-L-altropyranose hydrolase [Candidatus Melainabacteria bacterium]